MGQYYKVCNIDRREHLNPHNCGDGLKLMEFGSSGDGTLSVLAGLLAFGAEGRGPWAGNRLVVAGDYADEGRFVPPEDAQHNLYMHASERASTRDEPSPESGYAEVSSKGIEHLATLGVDVDVRRGLGTKEAPNEIAALADPERVYDQPEELFWALGAQLTEDLVDAMNGVLAILRWNGVGGHGWRQVDSAKLTCSRVTQLATSLTVVFSPHSTGAPLKKSVLKFPASTDAVRRWLGIAPAGSPAKARS